jgi:hypothetical protein
MAKWLLVVETNCTDTSRETEYNEWYDKIHIPDVLEVPGFVRATRCENTQPSEKKAKFLAAYEIETDDIDRCMKTVTEHIDRKKAEGRYNELIVMKSGALYRQISSKSK